MNIPSLNFRVLRNPGSFVVVGQAVIEVVVDTTDKGGQKQQLVEV